MLTHAHLRIAQDGPKVFGVVALHERGGVGLRDGKVDCSWQHLRRVQLHGFSDKIRLRVGNNC